MYVIREWSIRINNVRRTPPLVDTSGDSLRSVGTFHSFAFCQRFARVFLHTSLFVARTYNISWQCPNLEHKICKHFVWSRVRGPCAAMWFKVRLSKGDSTVLLFFFAMDCANISRVGSFPTPFSRAGVVCGFCNIVT